MSRLGAAKSALLHWLTRLAASRRITAGLYSLLSGQFASEHHAVLAGRAAHLRTRTGAEFRLRRNTHRIEKGLIMRPRKPSFAADYIEETIEAWATLMTRERTATRRSKDAEWSTGVLSAYFQASSGDPRIEKSRNRFLENLASIPPLHPQPHPHASIGPCQVDYAGFLALAERRQSVRWFLPERVPQNVIDQALMAAAESPSACNRQPYRLEVFLEPGRAAEVCALAPGTSGFAQQVPATIVVIGDLSAYQEARDRHLIYIDSGLAMMSFVLALETLGWSSCIVNWPDISRIDRAMSKQVKIAPHERIIFLIAVGRPDPEGLVPCSWKKDISSLRTYP